MTTIAEKRQLRKNLEKYEGRVAHMYLDSKGFVTVGVGHLLSSLLYAQKLPFTHANGKLASQADIKVDYDAVKAQPANRFAFLYKPHTKLSISNTEIDKLTDKHIDSFEKELKRLYTGFNHFPSEVKLALFDMIFNLGMTNLNNQWPVFNSAIRAKDWQKAANNSNRKPPIASARNKYVKDLLTLAAQKAKPANAVATP